MILTGKRKRKLDPKLAALPTGTTLTLAVPLDARTEAKARSLGFTDALAAGERLLPSGELGPVSHFNAEGKEIVHKDQPMETAYRQVEWEWEQWRGRHTETMSKIVDVPYQRYPRTPVPPPSEELTIAADAHGKRFVVLSPCVIGTTAEELLLHKVNLLLEIFGFCQVSTGDLAPILPADVRRLNWQVLPPGKYPWEKVKPRVTGVLQNAKEQTRVVVAHRLEKITSFSPDFVALGQAGFAGYLVFGFTKRGLYMLECVYTGNATYVFGDQWEELSRKTKAEILHGKLQKDRLIHREGWDKQIEKVLK